MTNEWNEGTPEQVVERPPESYEAREEATYSGGPSYDRPQPTPEGQRGYRSLFWPILLIGVGALLLLINLGLLEWSAMWQLMKLWPVALIAVGVDILLARRSPLLGALIGFALVGGAIAWVILNPGSTDALTTSNSFLTAPLDGAESADIRVDFSIGDASLEALSDSPNLFEADVTYIGDIEFDVQGNDNRSIILRQRNQAFSGPDFADFGNPFDDNSDYPLSWDLGVAPGIPLELDLNAGAGSLDLDLTGLTLTDLVLNRGAGEATLVLPAGEYEAQIGSGVGGLDMTLLPGAEADISIETGVGDTRITFGEDVIADVEVSSGVGELSFIVPGGAPVQLIIEDSGLGEVHVPGWLTRIEGSDNEGVWQSENYSDGEGIRIEITGSGVGGVTVQAQ